MPQSTAYGPLIAPLLLALAPVPAVAGDAEPEGPEPVPLAFETRQGTWMGVDLHPTGDRFLFDLLGDVYELPIEGGAATRLTSGPSWDTEPRYSPDGARILFSSDRGGNLNLWLMDADGGRPRPLTRADDQRTSDAAWSPDGDYLVARRRHTDTSSIGTWELWLHDRLGGDGVQITRKEEQAASEPAFSPDGRFVFFSARAARYAYDRDPNQGIWQVWRYDRHTGQKRPITGEHGGVVRPTPSPDGRRLAVVRRRAARTRLEILDLETGALRATGASLDPDEQEGFGVHGSYPRMDWFPDGRHLLLFAEGGFWKVDADTGGRTAIPFVAEVEQAITPAVRPARSAVEERVRARLIRWPAVSPDGRELVFGALGSLWRMELPDGEPRRLVDHEGRAFGPAWSPDGRSIAFVTWSDEEGGAVRIAPRGGGRSRVVSRGRAKYSNPSFSPDGRELVALRGSGGPERGHDLARELWSDVVIIDVRSGAETVVASTAGLKRAARPRFSADGRRVLFPEERPVERAAATGVLVSVNRDGTDRRDVLKVGQAQDVVPSPDGRWVAFKEHHHAWLARIPEAGRGPLELSREGGGVPVWRLSDLAGDWVDFSADGDEVTWGWGPELSRLELASLTAWEEQRQEEADGDDDDDDDDSASDEEVELPPSTTVAIDLRVPRAKPSGSVAVTGARIVTMRGDEVLEGATIVTVDDRIAAVGPDGTVAIPAGAKVLDGAGATIVPGLIDAHAHLHFSAMDVMPEQSWRYLANLAYGVTTVHDPSVYTDQAFTFAEMVEAGLMTGPRVFSTGMILYGAAGNFRSDVQSLEDARRHVRRMKALGAISIKSYQHPRREQRRWLVQACREEGILNVPEGGGDLWNDLGFVLDGHSAIEHAIPTVPLYEDAVRLLAASDTFWTPTLLVAYGGPAGEHFFYWKHEVWKDERLATFTPPGWLERKRRRRLVAPDDEWRHQEVARQAAKVAAAGGHVTLGGHGQLQGLGPHWELWALGGPGAMEPHQALRSATIEGARYLGMEADLGSLEPGKLADFVVLERNPLEAIENSDSVRWVVKNGELFDAATMDRLWPEPQRRPRMVWEIAEGVEPAHVVEE